MKHLALVPLIGGLALGAERALGLPPEAVLSYSAFAGNDRFYMNYLAQRGFDIKRYEIDEVETPTFGEIDVVTSVCPCAGLSTVTVGSGPGCKQNEWMKLSTRHVLKTVRPRVLVGENAPALATNAGRPVAQILRDIGKEFGYSMQLVKTSTHLHGIPQERTRSFFILYRDGGPYEIEWSHKEYDGTWLQFLDSFETIDDPDDWQPAEWQQELWELTKRIKQLNDKELMALIAEKPRSLQGICMSEGEEELAAYIERYKEDEEHPQKMKVAKTLGRQVQNVAEGRGTWDTSLFYRFNKNYKSVMWRTLASQWRPDHRRPLKLREQMRLMGLPEDFAVPRGNVNAICQNVPTCTAEWMVREVIAGLNGERKLWDGEGSPDGILRQNNINKKPIK